MNVESILKVDLDLVFKNQNLEDRDTFLYILF